MVSAVLPIDPLNALRLPAGNRNPSGYVNVYAKDRKWVARVKTGGRFLCLAAIDGSYRQDTPREAAKLVAAWYAARYGPDWHLQFRQPTVQTGLARLGVDRRRANPWVVRRSRGGFIVLVWEWGKCVTLGNHLHPTRPEKDRPNAPRPWVFPTPEVARAALKAWRVFGLRARWKDRAAIALGR